jgi:hypothetical protein
MIRYIDLTVIVISLFTALAPTEYGVAKELVMVGLAAAMFVGLFAFGAPLFGWSEAAHQQLQLGLFLSFVLGIICGYKTRG